MALWFTKFLSLENKGKAFLHMPSVINLFIHNIEKFLGLNWNVIRPKLIIKDGSSFSDGSSSFSFESIHFAVNLVFKSLLPWCRARDLFGSQILVTTGEFELRISYIRSSHLTHRSSKLGSKLKYLNSLLLEISRCVRSVWKCLSNVCFENVVTVGVWCFCSF